MYPIFIKLENRKVLVVGGGKIAFRKTESLIREGAIVDLISPDLCVEFDLLLSHNNVTWRKRVYKKGEASDYVLTVAATDDPLVNQRVFQDAENAGRLVNVVDCPDLCNFYVPSVVKKGSLRIAISTEGKYPALARKLREELSHELPISIECLVDELALFREKVIEYISDPKERKEVLSDILYSQEYEAYILGYPKSLRDLLKTKISELESQKK